MTRDQIALKVLYGLLPKYDNHPSYILNKEDNIKDLIELAFKIADMFNKVRFPKL